MVGVTRAASRSGKRWVRRALPHLAQELRALWSAGFLNG